MKRPSLFVVMVLLVHLSLIAAAVSFTTAPVAKPADKAIQGVIIPAPVAVAVEKAKPLPPEKPVEKPPKAKPLKPKKAPAKKPRPKAEKPNVAPLPAVPVAEASPHAVSAPDPAVTEPVSQQSKAKAEPEAEVSPPRASASSAVNKAPVYPMLSRRLKEQGTVYLHVLVLKNGTVGQLNIKQSSGFARLDQSALNAVRSWRYQPAERLGQAVDFWFVQPVVFNLNSIP